ncbi:MAG TPA: PAS domain S-box protein [Methylomirabilota bacterium]|nr:PAS domain S-box protein [Methylomirabilota bacterium]
MQRHIARSAVTRYGVAVASVAIAVMPALWLRSLALAGAQFLLVAVLITGLLSGLGPALAAWALATLVFKYYFTPPLDSLNVDVTQLPRLLVFASVSLLMVAVGAARHKAEGGLKSARDGLEQRVRERTARFRDLVNSVEGIVWEADAATLQFSFVSDQAERILGHPVERWFSEPTFWKDRLHPDDREKAVAFRGRASGESRGHEFEYRMIAASGRVVWLRDLVTVAGDGEHATQLRGVTVDITDRKHTETALRERAGLLDLTHDTVFVRDMNDVVTYWNRAAEEFYGWKAVEAIGKVSHHLTQTIFPEPFEHIQATLLQAGRWEGELVHTRSDGSQAVVASRWSLQRDRHGHPLAILETNNDITNRKQAEAKLRESERRYRYVFDATGVSICEKDFSEVKRAIDDLRSQGVRDFRNYCATHPDFVERAIVLAKTVDVNDVLVRLFGARDKDEILGALPRIWVPESRQVFVEVLVALAEGRASYETETVIQTLNGERLLVRLTMTFPPPPARLDRVLATLVDVTKGRRAEYLAGHVFETSPDAIYIVGRDYTYRRVNPMFARRWRMPAEAIVGLRMGDLAGQVPFEETYKPNLDRCFAGEEVSFGGWFPTPGGPRYLVATYSPLRPDSERVEAALAVSRDLTDHVRASEALQEAQAELAHVTRVMTLGELSASIAHEVNQPLAAIVADANASLNWLAASPPDLSSVREALDAIVKDGHRAADVIQRIRQLATKTSPQKARLDVNDVIRDVVPLIGTEVRSHEVSLRMDLAPALPPVLADRVQLQQVLINLVMNGIEAMASIGGRARELVVRSRPADEDQVMVSVRDSGVGIDARKMEELFSAFYTTKPDGMGMGLSISRSIMEAHGGRLWATPNADHGATFHFALPGM